jgi:hypothetical protein
MKEYFILTVGIPWAILFIPFVWWAIVRGWYKTVGVLFTVQVAVIAVQVFNIYFFGYTLKATMYFNKKEK